MNDQLARFPLILDDRHSSLKRQNRERFFNAYIKKRVLGKNKTEQTCSFSLTKLEGEEEVNETDKGKPGTP